MSPANQNRLFLLVCVASAAWTVIVGWESARNLDMLWDEQVDHRIALDLEAHPLTGSEETLDASQLRLPMYVNALAYAVTGRDDLDVSRGVSLGVAAVTIIATAVLGRMLFGPLVGGLAAILLALSPYFLSFARISMTEGDIFFACFVTLAILGFIRYMQVPTPGRWLAAGILLALAVGSKFFALVLVPVFVLLITSGGVSKMPVKPAGRAGVWGMHVVLAVGLLGCGVLMVLDWAHGDSGADLVLEIGWFALLAVWGCVAWLVLGRRCLAARPIPRLIGMIAFAALTCCVWMPVHATDHQIARTTVRRVLSWDNRLPLVLWSDHLRLYAGIILVKLTLPLGIVTALGLMFAGLREHEDGRWRPCILTIVFYVVGLCFLPLRQTFYLIGVYPLIMIVLAGFTVHVGRWLKGVARPLSWVWFCGVMFAIIHLAISTYASYPNYHLFGYDWVGNTWLGAESRGYRNLMQTPSDGVQGLIRWCNTSPRVFPGARVVSFLWEDQPHQVVDEVPPSSHYELVRRGLSDASDALPPPPSIEDADFVLVHINNLLGYGDRPPDWPAGGGLVRDFEKAFTVKRGSLEVAWVYARRAPERSRSVEIRAE